MSADFEKVLVKDPRLDVHDSIKYAVIKGGQNVTMAQYPAISQSPSQLIFNIQVPSEQTLIDRRVLLQTDLTLSVTTTDISGVLVGNASSCLYGQDSSLAAFPLHQLMTVLSATINNNTVSLNVRDALPAILRVLEQEDLYWYNGMTPTFNDMLGSYTMGCNSLANPNANYWAVNNPKTIPRGTFPFKFYSKNYAPGSPEYGAGNPVNIVETFTWTLTEPLLISPFIFSNLKANNQAFYGIQNLNIVVNIGNAERVFRGFNGPPPAGTSLPTSTTYLVPSPSPSSGILGATITAGVPWITNVSGGGSIPGVGQGASTTIPMFANTRLLFNFLTPHPSDLMPARNIVPFYELPRYITSIGNQVNAASFAVQSNSIANSSTLVPQAFNFSINSLQLNQIPDKLVFYIRQAASNQSYGSPDVAFPITGISINFNNNSGILATAQQVDLWQMSRNNGLNSSWLEFSGLANLSSMYTAVSLPPDVTNANYATVRAVQTVGSYVVLEFGKDIQLVEDFYAAGSLGNFNLQMNVYAQNTYGYSIAAGQLECVLITMNSGVFVCERGTSSTYTGILTKQDVLEASQQSHYTHDDVGRLVGGFNFMNMLKSGVQKLAPLAKKGLSMAADAGKDWAKGQYEKHKGALGDAAMGALGKVRDRAEGAISGAVSRATGARGSRRGRGYDDGLDGHLM